MLIELISIVFSYFKMIKTKMKTLPSFRFKVLSEDQAATDFIRPRVYGGIEFNIPGIEFSLDATSATCSEMQYLCVEFAKGDDPQRLEPRVPFTVKGVEGDLDESPAPKNLIGCTPIDSCRGKLLCLHFLHARNRT